MPTLGYLPTVPYYGIPDPKNFLPLIRLYAPFGKHLLEYLQRSPLKNGFVRFLVLLLATGKKPDKNLVEWCSQILLKHLNIGALINIGVGMVGFDVVKRLSEIDVPTLIIHGTEDRILSKQYAELLHRNIKNSTIRLVEGSGHCPHLEKPEEFNKTLIEFLNMIEEA